MNIEVKIDDSCKLKLPLTKEEGCSSSDARDVQNSLFMLKKILVGKKLDYIVNKSIWHIDFKEDSPVNPGNYYDIHFEDFGFIFDNQFLSIDIYEPWKYRINLNEHQSVDILITENINVSQWRDGYNDSNQYNDLSHIFNFMIGTELDDISLVINYEPSDDEDDDDYILEKFIMHFSNGKKIIIANQFDNPFITIE